MRPKGRNVREALLSLSNFQPDDVLLVRDSTGRVAPARLIRWFNEGGQAGVIVEAWEARPDVGNTKT
jgi:hypothetical protein